MNLQNFNDLFYNFLWSGKGDKIKRNIIINDYPDGGLKMIDIESFNKSLNKNHLDKKSILIKTIKGNGKFSLS